MLDIVLLKEEAKKIGLYLLNNSNHSLEEDNISLKLKALGINLSSTSKPVINKEVYEQLKYLLDFEIEGIFFEEECGLEMYNSILKKFNEFKNQHDKRK